MYTDLYMFMCSRGHFLLSAKTDDSNRDAARQAENIETQLKRKGLKLEPGQSRLFKLISEW